MMPILERGVTVCIFLLALNAFGFSVASIFASDEDRVTVVNYGIGAGIFIITILFIFFILGVIHSGTRKE